MQIRPFLSRNRYPRKIYWPWNISFPEPLERFLFTRETRFHGSVLAIRQLSQFTKHSVFLETTERRPCYRQFPFAIPFYFPLCITRLMVGLYPGDWKNKLTQKCKGFLWFWFNGTNILYLSWLFRYYHFSVEFTELRKKIMNFL